MRHPSQEEIRREVKRSTKSLGLQSVYLKMDFLKMLFPALIMRSYMLQRQFCFLKMYRLILQAPGRIEDQKGAFFLIASRESFWQFAPSPPRQKIDIITAQSEYLHTWLCHSPVYPRRSLDQSNLFGK